MRKLVVFAICAIGTFLAHANENEQGTNTSATCIETVTIVVNDGYTCGLSATGSLKAVVTPENAAVTYLWNNGATTAQIDNLVDGEYTVTVSDTCGNSISKVKQIDVSPFINYSYRSKLMCLEYGNVSFYNLSGRFPITIKCAELSINWTSNGEAISGSVPSGNYLFRGQYIITYL